MHFTPFIYNWIVFMLVFSKEKRLLLRVCRRF